MGANSAWRTQNDAVSPLDLGPKGLKTSGLWFKIHYIDCVAGGVVKDHL